MPFLRTPSSSRTPPLVILALLTLATGALSYLIFLIAALLLLGGIN